MVRFPLANETQSSVFGFALSFAILPTIFVLLRLLAHRLAHRKLDASDYTIVAACVFAVGLEACSITAVLNCGVGYHVVDIIPIHGPAPLAEFAQILVALQITWALSLSLTKISMLLLYTRIFEVQALVNIARVTAVFIILWATGTILAGFFICQPFAYNWDKTIPGGFCGNQVLSFEITGALNIVTDLMVVLLPLPVLYRLRLPLGERIVLLAVFSGGLLTCVVSAVRLSTLVSMDYNDITYTVPHANILSGLEPSVAVILACTLMLRPLMKREYYSSHRSTRNTNNSSARASRSWQQNGGSNGSSGASAFGTSTNIKANRYSRKVMRSHDYQEFDNERDGGSQIDLQPITARQ